MTIGVFRHMPQGWVCWLPAAKSKSRQSAAAEADPADGSRRAPKAEHPQLQLEAAGGFCWSCAASHPKDPCGPCWSLTPGIEAWWGEDALEESGWL